MGTRARGWALAGAVCVACSGAEKGGGAVPVVRDSAGVTVVELAALPMEGERAAGSVVLELTGEEGGGDPFERVAGVAVLGDGALAVADAGAARIRMYSARGEPLGSSGGRGEGPGEFRQIDALGVLPGDTLWIYDFGLRRFTLLPVSAEGPSGAPVIIPLLGALSSVSAAGILSDGSFVVREHWSSSLADGAGPGLQRAPVAVARVGRDGAVLDTLAHVSGREVVIGTEAGRRTMATPPWSRAAVVAVGGDRVWVGDQERSELRAYDPRGRLVRLVRWPSPRGGAAAWADSLGAIALEETDAAERADRRSWLEALPRPDSRPAHGRLLAGPAGEVWVAEWAPPGEAEARWWVLPDGAEAGVIRLPDDFRLLQVVPDRLVGVARDDFGVERVQVLAR